MWQVIVNLSDLSQILVWQALVNPSNIGVAAALPATLVPTALLSYNNQYLAHIKKKTPVAQAIL